MKRIFVLVVLAAVTFAGTRAMAATPQAHARLYINGVFNDRSRDFDHINTVTGGYIGRWTRGGEWRLNGTEIDEFRAYNVALSDDQIAQLATEVGGSNPMLPDNLVIQSSFEGSYANSATGAASAGATGDAIPNDAGGSATLNFISGQAGGGQAQQFGTGLNDLGYDDAALANVAGLSGATFSMFFKHGTTPSGTPGWLFNFTGTPGNDFGSRINTNSDSYRALANQGNFFGGGPANQAGFDHVTFVVTRAVPVPAAVWLAMPLLGGLGVAGWLRRRKSA